MKKFVHRILFCLLITASVLTCALVKDQKTLQEQLVRLHVVADSDSREDQAVKLQVRDAVLSSIQSGMEQAADAEEARKYLEENLPKIESAANTCLQKLGCPYEAVVTLCREAFDTRTYDTFRLPAGVYQALRVTIGEGKGHNWWCVAFPELCLPAVAADVEAVAADAGLGDGLRGAMTGRYRLRFFLLDLLGKWELRALPRGNS